ncbi:hypothetical protein MICAF_80012 [Microcystis aeruginosa PCC 9807]|uniref:Uncharacterized protein n=1 Tax=Microcystis aeruginosa PCC 9807 TaxID=1160283 RepID=I4HEU2_MICAE|nr:hypothetical protein MICAF_80012 [Microcystis aeruginosa PCC 9807]
MSQNFTIISGAVICYVSWFTTSVTIGHTLRESLSKTKQLHSYS